MSRFQAAPVKDPPVHDHPLSPGGTTYALLDTNVLIPARLSDVLFDCAGQGLFLPRWTRTIEDEFVSNWGDVVFGVSSADKKARKEAGGTPPPDHIAGAKKRLSCFRGAVGLEWEIIGYDEADILARVPSGVDKSDIPHVAACLVLLDSLSEENSPFKIFLVSKNLKDLSVKKTKALGVEVLTPGKFLDRLMEVAPSRVEAALDRTMSDLRDYGKAELLRGLQVHKAHKTAKHFAKAWGIQLSMEKGPTP